MLAGHERDVEPSPLRLLPRGQDVPLTTALGGAVFVAVLFNLASPTIEFEIFGAWGLFYVAECVARNRVRLRLWLDLPEARACVLSALLLAIGVLADAADTARPLRWSIYAGVYLAAGWGPAVAGLRALRRKSIDVELLMVVAALCAAGVGQPFDGALLFVIFATSRALAALATKRTQDSVRSLLTLAPEHARKIIAGGEDLVPATSLAVADEVLVRPGERIGADGEVVSGHSEVDQASITGEPLPVPKGPSDEVFAGTINGAGVLRFRVTRPGAESVLARIVAMVDQASATKAQTQMRLERMEQRYSTGVVAATAAFVILPLSLGSDFRPVLLRAMAFMIVASPCAFTLATMPALLAAIANAGRHGVLVKGADVMERLGKVTTMAFDKTGSLTLGAPHVVDVVLLSGTGMDAAELLRVAGAAEQASEHPLGAAIVAEALARGLVLPESCDFRSEAGCGVHATVGGRRITVGSPTAFAADDDVLDAARELAQDGCTVLVVVADLRPVGLIALRDQLRPDGVEAVAALRELTDDEPVLLTGDGPGAACLTGAQAGISDVRAQLLPADKVSAIRELQAAGKRVTYVGDGLNDAPALAAADVGVAMAHGADLTLETSDVVIVHGELATLPAMIELSNRAYRVVLQNFALAGAVVLSLIALDVVGLLPLPAAVAGHESSTLLVALNGLRLLRAAAWRVAPARGSVAIELRRYVLAGAACLGLGLLAAHALGRS